MRRPRLTIARWMRIVAIVGLNIGILRSLHGFDSDLAQGVAITGVALQIGVGRMLRGRGDGSSFWAGFVAIGALMLVTFIESVLFPDSIFNHTWIIYTKYVNRYLNRFTHVWDYYNRTQNGAVLMTTLALVWSVPQLILALLGGLTARTVERRNSALAR